jgi:hypothetical protein
MIAIIIMTCWHKDSIQIPCPIRDLLIATISFNFKLHTHFGHPSAEYELSLQWCLSHNSALEGKTRNKSSNSTPSILHKYLLGSIVLLRSHSNFQWDKSLGGPEQTGIVTFSSNRIISNRNWRYHGRLVQTKVLHASTWNLFSNFGRMALYTWTIKTSPTRNGLLQGFDPAKWSTWPGYIQLHTAFPNSLSFLHQLLLSQLNYYCNTSKTSLTRYEDTLHLLDKIHASPNKFAADCDCFQEDKVAREAFSIEKVARVKKRILLLSEIVLSHLDKVWTTQTHWILGHSADKYYTHLCKINQ